MTGYSERPSARHCARIVTRGRAADHDVRHEVRTMRAKYSARVDRYDRAFRALRPAGNRSQRTLPRRPLIVMVVSQSLTWIAGFWWALTKLAKARRS